MNVEDNYDYTVNVSYLNNEQNENKIYRNFLARVFKIDSEINVDMIDDDFNNDEYFKLYTEKIELLFHCLKNNHKEFIKNLFNKLLTINDNYIKLSNNLYFYICCCNFSKLCVDITKDFNILDYLNNEKVELFLFTFLFSFQCFEHFHLMVKNYFLREIKKEENIENDENNILNELSCSFVSLFNNT
jgi:hypothetical protein